MRRFIKPEGSRVGFVGGSCQFGVCVMCCNIKMNTFMYYDVCTFIELNIVLFCQENHCHILSNNIKSTNSLSFVLFIPGDTETRITTYKL